MWNETSAKAVQEMLTSLGLRSEDAEKLASADPAQLADPDFVDSLHLSPAALMVLDMIRGGR